MLLEAEFFSCCQSVQRDKELEVNAAGDDLHLVSGGATAADKLRALINSGGDNAVSVFY